jgi:glycosyltransferase involved in cell wall biosynthesis
MRIALVHDALNQIGGAEYVLRALHDMFPHAPIFTLVDDGQFAKMFFKRADIRTSFIQKLPWGIKKFKWYLPLHPTAMEHFDLSSYDVVISDSSAFSKGIITRPETIHICYCHTPPRFLWHDTHNYTEDLHQNRSVKRFLPAVLTYLRSWDQLAAQRVDKFIANSYTTARRIKKYYRRDSTVINPPIVWDDFYIEKNIGDFYLMVGRLRPYKRFDLAIKAFNKLGLPLVIVGRGEEYKRLRRMAGPNIMFLQNINDQQKAWLFARAQAFIHPQEEDFGFAAVESMAAGRPVLAYNRGAAIENIIPGVTGAFFKEQSVDALIEAVRAFEPNDYNPEVIREHARRYDISVFQQQIWAFIMQARRERAQQPLPEAVRERWAISDTRKAHL